MDNSKRNSGGSIPAMDEGWWEAVLAEEGSSRTAHGCPGPSHGPCRAAGIESGTAPAAKLGQGEGPLRE